MINLDLDYLTNYYNSTIISNPVISSYYSSSYGTGTGSDVAISSTGIISLQEENRNLKEENDRLRKLLAQREI